MRGINRIEMKLGLCFFAAHSVLRCFNCVQEFFLELLAQKIYDSLLYRQLQFHKGLRLGE